MSVPALETVLIEPDNTHKSSVIWLHGLGADGYDFAGLVPDLQLPSSLGLRFIFPHAPFMPVTINAGQPTRAWFDLYSLEAGAHEDESGIAAMENAIQALIQGELDRGIPAKKILLAGFSQGGAMALHTALGYHLPLAGVMGLSTYLPLANKIQQQVSAENRALPIFLAHGMHDPVIPIEVAEIARRSLKKLNYALEWHSFAMEHAVCAEEIQVMRAWMLNRLT